MPANHPLRLIRTMVIKALDEMGELYAQMYEDGIKGERPSIAPETLLQGLLLQALYLIRSALGAPFDAADAPYNLLFRWLIGLSMGDLVWVPTVFTKNGERLIEHDAMVALFNVVLKQADKKQWLSKEHFSVDGTEIQAWAGHKSFGHKDGKKSDQVFMMAMAAYNLMRLRTLAQIRLAGREKRGKRLEMTSKQIEIGIKWGDPTSESTRTVEKRTSTRSNVTARVGYFRSLLGTRDHTLEVCNGFNQAFL